ncbi:MAG: hypothetical protein L0215_11125 [Gemmataceae bacterium]|nr:hypothetical protein [Gemmataceae bacterium]
MGGTGADTLRGGAREDVLVGNSTAHDNNLAALLALMAEWGRTDLDYVSRAGHLTGTAGGLNGGVYLNSSTIADDGAKDELYGGRWPGFVPEDEHRPECGRRQRPFRRRMGDPAG